MNIFRNGKLFVPEEDVPNPAFVWLDDVRPMPEGFNFHAYNSEEAIRALGTGYVQAISLDHDLGPYDGDTGYRVACFIEEGAFGGWIPRIKVSIHSANPVGRKNMEAALRNAERSWTSRGL